MRLNCKPAYVGISQIKSHDSAIAWKRFTHYYPCMSGIYQNFDVFFVVNLGQLLVILDPMLFTWCYCNITKWLHPFPLQIHDFEIDYLITFYRKNKCNLFPMFFIYCIFTFDDMVSRVICWYDRNTEIELIWLHGPIVPATALMQS